MLILAAKLVNRFVKPAKSGNGYNSPEQHYYQVQWFQPIDGETDSKLCHEDLKVTPELYQLAQGKIGSDVQIEVTASTLKDSYAVSLSVAPGAMPRFKGAAAAAQDAPK